MSPQLSNYDILTVKFPSFNSVINISIDMMYVMVVSCWALDPAETPDFQSLEKNGVISANQFKGQSSTGA